MGQGEGNGRSVQVILFSLILSWVWFFIEYLYRYVTRLCLRYEALSSLDKPEKEKLFDDHIDRLIKKKKASIPSSILDPWHFGADPDPRIYASH